MTTNRDVLMVWPRDDTAPGRNQRGTAIFGRRLAARLGGAFHVLQMGEDNQCKTNDLGADVLFTASHSRLAAQSVPFLRQVVCRVIDNGQYRVVLGNSAVLERDLLSQVAARTASGMAGDVFDAVDVDGAVGYRRSVYAGNVVATTVIDTPLQVLTVRPTTHSPIPQVSFEAHTVNMEGIDMDATSPWRTRFVASQTDRPGLTEAAVVVAVGGGVHGNEDFAQVQQLADTLGAAIGGTRVAVDRGMIPNDFQVGQTGKIIAPRLYIALGISGALQHVAGIRGAGTVVAVNKDEDAPIFRVADWGMVGDVSQVIPDLITTLKNR